MSDFLTLEDVNGTIFRDGVNGVFYEINTADIDADGDFSDVVYDFVKVSRTKSNGSYTFTFEVKNSAWTGAYYFKKLDGTYIDENATYNSSTGKISYTTSNKNIILVVYCSALKTRTFFSRILYIPESNLSRNIYFNQIGDTYYQGKLNLKNGLSAITRMTYSVGVVGVSITVNSFENYAYGICRLIKTDFQFNCNQDLIVGTVNRVKLGTHNNYKPNGDMIGDNTPNITVLWNNTEIPVTWDSTVNDYVFDLDLTEKTVNGKVRFKVLVDNNLVLNYTETNVVLNLDYQVISSYSDLVNVCGADSGVDFVQLDTDIIFNDRIMVEHPIKIIGNEHSIDLNGYGFNLNEGVQFIVENVTFNNGDTAIIQAENTKVELTTCTFNNCTSTNYNGLGSCIFCDVDIDSLSIETDFITDIKECAFYNNSNCILHGGELSVTKSVVHNTETTNINTNNSAFLYQTDGIANINNSIFDIEYAGDELCSNQINIGFAQTVLMCGEMATVNGANHTELQNNDSLPFFDEDYNNRSHILAKYYYPQIENCVYTSPTPSKEDKCICYCVSGVDWVFKENAQVTRVGEENNDRRINWEVL